MCAPLLSVYPTQVLLLPTSGSRAAWVRSYPLKSRLRKFLCLLPVVQYAQGPLLDNLYWTKWYNNESLAAHNTQSYIYYENLLLGVPRMRQLKVKNNSCVVHDDFKEEISGCYDVYSEDKEEKVSFGLINGTA